jgi:hypothetical protein
MPTPEEFQVAIGRWLQEALDQAPSSDNQFVDLFASHLGADPKGLPIVAESWDEAEHPNLQRALDAYGQGQTKVVGVASPNKRFSGITLSELLVDRYAPLPGPIEYINRQIGPEETLPCVQFGAYLLTRPEGPVVVFVRGPGEHSAFGHGQLEVMGLERETAEAVIGQLRALMSEHNVYRGQVLTFSYSQHGVYRLEFGALPRVSRDQVILPALILEEMERHTMGMAEMARELKASSRHLKRGMLLYGPPGTGKTHSLSYLASQMPERTVILLTGAGLQVLGRAFALARSLAPAMVVLEDVDLVARSRDLPGMDLNPMLFELLNQMDGLNEDIDLIVILTTNRADLLEPALAARPGRIDQALEIPLPDADSRQRLFGLYGKGLDLGLDSLDRHVERTAGASPAFIKELLRRGVVDALEEGMTTVTDRHIEDAITDMLESGAMLRGILGGGPQSQ